MGQIFGDSVKVVGSVGLGVVGDARIFAGEGDPNGVVQADVGSLFLRVDGGGGLFRKTSNPGQATGWLSVSINLPPGNQASGFVNIGAAAGNFGHTQLFNPVGSGINVHLFFLSVGANGGLPTPAVQSFDTPLTTLVAGQSIITDRRVTPSTPIAELRSQLNVALLGTIIGSKRPSGGATMEWDGTDLRDWVLTPGTGYVATARVVNSTVSSWWMWTEETV